MTTPAPVRTTWIDEASFRVAVSIMNENYAAAAPVWGSECDRHTPASYLAQQLSELPADEYGVNAAAKARILAAVEEYQGDMAAVAALYNDQRIRYAGHRHPDDPRPLGYAALNSAVHDWIHSHGWILTEEDGAPVLEARRAVGNDEPGKCSREHASRLLQSDARPLLRIGSGATRPVWLPSDWRIA